MTQVVPGLRPSVSPAKRTLVETSHWRATFTFTPVTNNSGRPGASHPFHQQVGGDRLILRRDLVVGVEIDRQQIVLPVDLNAMPGEVRHGDISWANAVEISIDAGTERAIVGVEH
jgi:hypothetical protein